MLKISCIPEYREPITDNVTVEKPHESHCVECMRVMHPIDAAQSLTCRACSGRMPAQIRTIRRIYDVERSEMLDVIEFSGDSLRDVRSMEGGE